MKLLGLLTFLLLLAASCESEYQKQLAKARELVVTEHHLRSAASTGMLPETIMQIEKAIRFRAHLSGNERVFMEDLENYRSKLLLEADAAMIMQFP